MNMANLDGSILSLVTFIPLAGALLLLLFPRRDRDIKVFALVVSLLAFVASLHLPAHFQRGAIRISIRARQCLDSASEYPLPHGD